MQPRFSIFISYPHFRPTLCCKGYFRLFNNVGRLIFPHIIGDEAPLTSIILQELGLIEGVEY